MKNLIPYFIQEKINKSEHHGFFQAVVMFIDIHGFTNLTERAMRQGGDEGAEIISRIFNQNVIVNAIYEREGFISIFAGDAFTAIFPNVKNRHGAIIAAEKILSLFDQTGFRKSLFGDLDLHIKIGVAYGTVEWGILGGKEKAYFFRGEAIDACIKAEQNAAQGEIILTREMLDFVIPRSINYESKSADLFRFISINIPDNEVSAHPAQKRHVLAKEVVGMFFSDKIIDFDQLGEFRNSVAIFIAFNKDINIRDLDLFFNVLITHIKIQKGYLNKIDFSDKGGIALCIFGIPELNEKNLQNSLDFALSLQKELLNLKLSAPLLFKIGMAYGTAYAGIVGGHKRCEYTVIGDMVNLASRLTTHAAYGEIWVNQDLYRFTKDDFEFSPIGEFTFKGKTNESAVYSLRIKTESKTDFNTGIIGNQQQFAEIIQELNAPQNSLIILNSLPGLGKTLMLEKISKQFSSLAWLELPVNLISNIKDCYDSLIIDCYCSHLLNTAQTLDIAANCLITEFEKILHKIPDQKNEPGQLKYHYLQTIGQLSADEKKNLNTPSNFLHWLLANHCENGPLNIIIDDLDPYFDHFLEFIISVLSNHDMQKLHFLMTTSSLNITKKIKQLSSMVCRFIRLQPLDLTDTGILIKQSIGESLPQPYVEQIYHYSAGIPFLIKQFLNCSRLIEHIQKKSKVDAMNLLDFDFTFPYLVTDFIVAQFDKLNTRLKSLIQTAVVFGYSFDSELLGKIMQRISTGWNQSEVNSGLETAVEMDVLIKIDDRCYQFYIPIFRDVIYRLPLRQKIREVHWLIADTLERQQHGTVEIYKQLAFHYKNAQIFSKATEFQEKVKQ